jgi:hypothetical protein
MAEHRTDPVTVYCYSVQLSSLNITLWFVTIANDLQSLPSETLSLTFKECTFRLVFLFLFIQ